LTGAPLSDMGIRTPVLPPSQLIDDESTSNHKCVWLVRRVLTEVSQAIARPARTRSRKAKSLFVRRSPVRETSMTLELARRLYLSWSSVRTSPTSSRTEHRTITGHLPGVVFEPTRHVQLTRP